MSHGPRMVFFLAFWSTFFSHSPGMRVAIRLESLYRPVVQIQPDSPSVLSPHSLIWTLQTLHRSCQSDPRLRTVVSPRRGERGYWAINWVCSKAHTDKEKANGRKEKGENCVVGPMERLYTENISPRLCGALKRGCFRCFHVVTKLSQKSHKVNALLSPFYRQRN